MNETRFHRQLDLLDLKLSSTPITIIGAGATGSFTALTLAKMGFTELTVFDFDTVEEHNLPNQFYRTCDIGKPKVLALQEIIRDFEGIEIKARNEKYRGQRISGVVICCVDSMDIRLLIWNFVKMNTDVKLYIDSRMGTEVMQMFSVNPNDLAQCNDYEQTLFPSSEALPVRCTAKTIMYTVLSIASFLASQVKKFVMKEPISLQVVFDLKTVTLFV